MSQTVVGFVLQRELQPNELPLYESEETPYPFPDTVIVPAGMGSENELPLDSLRSHTLQQIIDNPYIHTLRGSESEPYFWGLLEKGRVLATNIAHTLKIDSRIANKVGISHGDRVTLNIDDQSKLVTIVDVNGNPDFASVRKWPRIEGRGAIQAGYPREILPLGQFSHSLRVIELLAPVGFGQNVYLVAPGWAGKTYILVDVCDACLKLTQVRNNLFVITVFMGERSKDIELYADTFSKGDYRKGRAELYVSPETDRPANRYAVFKYAVSRAKRLAVYHDVVLIIDSLTRAVSAHSYGGYAKPDSGMIRGGIHIESLDAVAQNIGGAGYFRETGTSLTIFNSVLDSQEPTASALVQFARETKDNIPDSIWTLRADATQAFPKISMNKRETMTRRLESFIPPALQEEIELVLNHVYGYDEQGHPLARLQDTHKELVKYARDNPIPAYTQRGIPNR